MACKSITKLLRDCGATAVLGGVQRLYMLAYKDLVAITGSTEVYEIGASGYVTDIGLASGIKFQEIGILTSTSGLSEEMTVDQQAGVMYFTQTLPLILSGMNPANKSWVESVLLQPVVAIVKTRTGGYAIAGLSGELRLSALTGGTGIAEGDVQGYTLSFTGIDNKLIPMVDPTLIATIIDTDNTPVNYDTVITFATNVTGAAAGVSATVTATTAVGKFEFDSISPRVGQPRTTSLTIGGDEEATLSFTDDYAGAYFRYTTAAGVAYTAQFPSNGAATVPLVA